VAVQTAIVIQEKILLLLMSGTVGTLQTSMGNLR